VILNVTSIEDHIKDWFPSSVSSNLFSSKIIQLFKGSLFSKKGLFWSQHPISCKIFCKVRDLKFTTHFPLGDKCSKFNFFTLEKNLAGNWKMKMKNKIFLRKSYFYLLQNLQNQLWIAMAIFTSFQAKKEFWKSIKNWLSLDKNVNCATTF